MTQLAHHRQCVPRRSVYSLLVVRCSLTIERNRKTNPSLDGFA
jgi:hypothetical protein